MSSTAMSRSGMSLRAGELAATSRSSSNHFIPVEKRWSLSHVRLSATPWTVAHQAPLSMDFSRKEHWSGQPFPSPGDLPDPGTEPWSPPLQADSFLSESPGKPVYGPSNALLPGK